MGQGQGWTGLNCLYLFLCLSPSLFILSSFFLLLFIVTTTLKTWPSRLPIFTHTHLLSPTHTVSAWATNMLNETFYRRDLEPLITTPLWDNTSTNFTRTRTPSLLSLLPLLTTPTLSFLSCLCLLKHVLVWWFGLLGTGLRFWQLFNPSLPCPSSFPSLPASTSLYFYPLACLPFPSHYHLPPSPSLPPSLPLPLPLHTLSSTPTHYHCLPTPWRDLTRLAACTCPLLSPATTFLPLLFLLFHTYFPSCPHMSLFPVLSAHTHTSHHHFDLFLPPATPALFHSF